MSDRRKRSRSRSRSPSPVKKGRWDNPKDTNSDVVKLKVTDSLKAVSDALAKARQAAVLQKQVQERMRMQGKGAGIGGSAWAPLLLDKQGRQIDGQGNVIKVERNVSTLKVNMNQEIRARTEKNLLLAGKPLPDEAPRQNKHFDPRMSGAKLPIRESRSLRFVKPGKYIARAQTMRMKQISREMRSHQFDSESGELLTARGESVKLEPIPAVEWWDQQFVNNQDYDQPVEGGGKAITNLIHVPVVLKPVSEDRAPPPMPIMLTVKERKRIKKIKKEEKKAEIQDKIRLGLMAPPEPKMRLSNMMRVLGTDAIMEPSAMEAKVRKQMADRQTAHEAHNAAMKLTPEQKKAKKHKKLTEDTSREVHVAVFRAGDLQDVGRRFKVDIHAQQYQMTGTAVLYGNCNVVVIEGGPKGIKKYIRLMMHRIQWVPEGMNEGDVEEQEEEDEDGNLIRKVYKKCALVWQGTVAKRTFKQFRFEICRSEKTARQIFVNRGVPHYWDM